MTTAEIRLNPNKVAELEPVNKIGTYWQMLSPFSVPVRIDLITDSPSLELISKIRVGYSVAEKGGEVDVELLDKDARPAVEVAMSKSGNKIVSLRFLPPIELDALEDVTARLATAAEQLQGAKSLSYRMVASILKEVILPAAKKFAITDPKHFFGK